MAKALHHYFGNGKFRNAIEQWELRLARNLERWMGSSQRLCLDKRAGPRS
jgi:hypothetical protein